MSNKKYGLILPGAAKTRQPTFQAARNVFGDDSDSDDDSKKKSVLLQPSHNINRQAKISQDKALMEDPTVYQYDEIYDSMTNEKEEKKSKSKGDKKPRYIENLMKSANKRKIENERRIERQIQKEREKEGDEFADKEVFVTSAYKKKLEEMKLEEEKEKREEYLESIGDVTKQRDLGGFYRHLYEQKLGSDKKADENKEDIKKSEELKESDGSLTPEKPETIEKRQDNSEKAAKHMDSQKKRNYRKRKSSSDNQKHLSEGEIDDSDEEIKRVNLTDIREAKRSKPTEENIDADSDFSIDESSDEEDTSHRINIDKNLQNDTPVITNLPAKNEETKTKKERKSGQDSKLKEEKVEIEQKDLKPKIDIWKKRTVGEVFEQALKQYYERKAGRGY
ncbi:nuclear speckle splicing regulatory protein 1 [Pectinophora gossypiella]|nr:nuclear speckle splicing regulatory protein 1 [Pectinophora gossypiella]XP_049881622.1 nuclear speckle splicing regulatory protein 1 [Pectinophora gossypiella]